MAGEEAEDEEGEWTLRAAALDRLLRSAPAVTAAERLEWVDIM